MIDNQQQVHQLHNTLPLVRELRKNGFTNIKKLNIKIRRGTKHPNLIEFRYLSSASFDNPQCRDARGIILDQSNNFFIVALPYYKFFGHDDHRYSQIKQFNFNNYKIYEKYDGSLASVYYYKGQWHVASSGIPDGQTPYYFNNQAVQNGEKQENELQKLQQKPIFRAQFWRVFQKLGFQLPKEQDQNKTFVFELMSKKVVIVVNRDQDGLVLHGVRNMDNLQQQDPKPYGQKYGWKVSQPFELEIKNKQNPIAQILQITESLDPIKQEGFVLCDDKYLRLKVKNSKYKQIHWQKQLRQKMVGNQDKLNTYLLQQIILAGKAQNFKTYWPKQWVQKAQSLMKSIEKMNQFVHFKYEKSRNLSQKQYALETRKQDRLIQPLLFLLFKDCNKVKGKLQTFIRSQTIINLIAKYNFELLLAEIKEMQ